MSTPGVAPNRGNRNVRHVSRFAVGRVKRPRTTPSNHNHNLHHTAPRERSDRDTMTAMHWPTPLALDPLVDDGPSPLVCPITRRLPREPVMLASTGRTFERDAIERWLTHRAVDPVDPTVPASSLELVPNLAARELVEAHARARGALPKQPHLVRRPENRTASGGCGRARRRARSSSPRERSSRRPPSDSSRGSSAVRPRTSSPQRAAPPRDAFGGLRRWSTRETSTRTRHPDRSCAPSPTNSSEIPPSSSPRVEPTNATPLGDGLSNEARTPSIATHACESQNSSPTSRSDERRRRGRDAQSESTTSRAAASRSGERKGIAAWFWNRRRRR